MGKTGALPIYPKKRYIVVDLTKYVPKKDDSAESSWLNLFKTMPYAKRTPKCKDEVFTEIYECMRMDESTDVFITEVATNMIDRDEYNAGISYALRTGFEEGLEKGELVVKNVVSQKQRENLLPAIRKSLSTFVLKEFLLKFLPRPLLSSNCFIPSWNMKLSAK